MHMLCKIISVVEMYDSLLVSLHNIIIKQKSLGDILADLACHIVSLYAVHGRVLIGVFLLYFLVITFDKA